MPQCRRDRTIFSTMGHQASLLPGRQHGPASHHTELFCSAARKPASSTSRHDRKLHTDVTQWERKMAVLFRTPLSSFCLVGWLLLGSSACLPAEALFPPSLFPGHKKCVLGWVATNFANFGRKFVCNSNCYTGLPIQFCSQER